jgi:hypothetical protein
LKLGANPVHQLRVLLVNASHPSYNLGMEKAARYWQRNGAYVSRSSTASLLFGFDLVWISAIFSWHVRALIDAAIQAQAFGAKVEIGGPGCFGLRKAILDSTGLVPQSSPDPRFEQEVGTYLMVFWSRGCPAKNCSLGFPRSGQLPVCSVPEMEGWKYTLYPDATPARLISDNNLSALPRFHQELIVEKTLSAGFPSVDANSGFEPRSVRPWVIELWKRLPLVAWRFAYDELGERDAVLKTIAMLDELGVRRHKLHIYCLAGNEPLAECESRVREINEWGAKPIVQRRRPLDWMEGPLPCLYDWSEQALINFQRWGNRLGKGMPFCDYRRGFRDRDAEIDARPNLFAEAL